MSLKVVLTYCQQIINWLGTHQLRRQARSWSLWELLFVITAGTVMLVADTVLGI